jgi:hypothetical protein
MGFFDDIFGGSKGDWSNIEDKYNQMMQQAQDYIKQMYGQGRTDITQGVSQAYDINKPYMQAGTTALDAYLSSLGLGSKGQQGVQDVYNQFTTGPGYQFALKQGMQSTQQAAAAKGLGGSGAEQAQLQQLGQGMAQQEWNNYLSNYQSKLSNIAGIGQSSAEQQAQIQYGGGQSLANLGLQYSGMNVGVLENQAKAQAEAAMAQQSMRQQGWGNIFGALGQLGGAAIGGMTGGMTGMGGAGGSLASYFSKLFGGGSGGGSLNYFNPSYGGGSNQSGYNNYGQGMFG